MNFPTALDQLVGNVLDILPATGTAQVSLDRCVRLVPRPRSHVELLECPASLRSHARQLPLELRLRHDHVVELGQIRVGCIAGTLCQGDQFLPPLMHHHPAGVEFLRRELLSLRPLQHGLRRAARVGCKSAGFLVRNPSERLAIDADMLSNPLRQASHVHDSC
jgi:hypothetical protein